MKVSVIGLGYVGSVAASGLASAGHDVIGIDINEQKIEAYRLGDVQLYEPGLMALMRNATQYAKLRFMTPDEVSEPLGDAIVVAVGTPPSATGSADLTQVRDCIAWIREKQPDSGVVVMKSTVPPGTGVRLKEQMLSGCGLEYASNPEFLREGSAVYDWFYPDRIVVGAFSEEQVEVVRRMYSGIDAPYMISDITSAEMAKYAANAFLATKISFVNEIAALCDRLGANIDDVVDGIAKDPRIGGSFLRAGVGYGGSCFPKDVRALDQVALTNNHNFELLRSVITVNNRQRLLPLYALRECFGQLAGLDVAVLGLAFKPNTDDVREAPAIELIRHLADDGANVRAFDPKAAASARRELPSGVQVGEDLMDCVDGAQALVLMTEWDEIVDADWSEIAGLVMPPRFVFDGRNALNPKDLQEQGFNYRGIGRGAHQGAASFRAVLSAVGG